MKRRRPGEKPRARKQHQAAKSEKQTCIDCHQGIAHDLPEKPDG